MTYKSGSKRFLVLAMLFCFCSQAFSQTECYPNVPKVLEDSVGRVAAAIVKKLPAPDAVDELDDLFYSIVFYTVADAVAVTNSTSIHSLEAYQYIGETARTDKQIGTSARSEGSTSAAEKPGFAELLGFAIEHGAIQKEVNGTSLTLSTTPYAFVAWANRADTASLYQRVGFLNRLGLSASFNISNMEAPLQDVNNKQLTEASLRVRLFGDRSARSKKFQEFWIQHIRPKIEGRLAVLTKAFSRLGNDAAFRSSVDPLRSSLKAEVKAYLDAHQTPTADDVRKVILCSVRRNLFVAIKDGTIKISSDFQNAINTELIPSLAAAHDALAQARKDLDEEWDKFSKGALATVAVTNHRTTMGSDYTEAKLLYEVGSPVKFIGNGWVTIYSNPNRALNQEQIRDYGVTASLEAQGNSPFLKDTPDLSKITFALTFRYQRMKENEGVMGRRPDIAVFQAKTEIPIRAGVSVPLSFTWANATELIKEKHVRGNFGISFDVDKLFSLAHRAVNP